MGDGYDQYRRAQRGKVSDRTRSTRRGSFEIHMDILLAISRGFDKPAELMKEANASWKTIQAYLSRLANAKLIEEVTIEGHRSYALTAPGFDSLKTFEQLSQTLRPKLDSSKNVSSTQPTTFRVSPVCDLCGRLLGVGFYYSCHTCGANYCYAHAPEKCDHRRLKLRAPELQARKRKAPG